jgi:long-chain acyl-CoA synthetase
MDELAALVRGVLKLDPQAQAMEYEQRWRTWGDLDRIVAAVDEALADAGLGKGARIGGMLRNHPLVGAALLSVITREQCVVTLNAALPDERLAEDIRALKPPALVGLERDWARPAVRAAAAEIGCVGLLLADDGEQSVRLVEGLERASGAGLVREAPGVAIDMLTSGTTGRPKRIPLTAQAFEKAVVGAGVYDGRKPGDPPRLRGGVQILCQPFAHISGLFGLFNCVAAGRASSVLERFAVEPFVDAVRRHRPPVASAPPSALRMILDAQTPKADLASLKVFRVGTAPLPADLADEFHDRYGIPVLQNYGATEFAGGVAGWTLADFRKHPRDKRGSVGRLNPGVEARVVDPETGASLPLGEEGLLELRSQQLGDGVSWMRTTDLAVLDADGFLWIKGRADNAIIRGGFKVFPDDVVKALEGHPAVREAAVVGLADPRLGQVPAAAFIVRAGVEPPSEDGLRTFLRERLAPYQVPARFMQVADFPRTPSLKVSQPDLKALFEGGAG